MTLSADVTVLIACAGIVAAAVLAAAVITPLLRPDTARHRRTRRQARRDEHEERLAITAELERVSLDRLRGVTRYSYDYTPPISDTAVDQLSDYGATLPPVPDAEPELVPLPAARVIADVADVLPEWVIRELGHRSVAETMDSICAHAGVTP